MRVALYLRVSTDRQTTDNQAQALEQYAGRQNWEIVRTFRDVDSGANPARPELQQLFQCATEGHIDRVLIFALDRLTREGPLEALQYVARLKRAGVDLWSMTEEHFRASGPAGDLFLSIAAWIAAQERTRHVERIRAGQDRARAQGKTIGRPRRITDRETIIALRTVDQLTYSQIARATKTPRATVARICKQHHEETHPHEDLLQSNFQGSAI